jgi:hypothetical protein
VLPSQFSTSTGAPTTVEVVARHVTADVGSIACAMLTNGPCATVTVVHPVVTTLPGMVITTAYVPPPSGGTNVSDPDPVEIGTPDAPGPTNRDVPPHPDGRWVVHVALTD